MYLFIVGFVVCSAVFELLYLEIIEAGESNQCWLISFTQEWLEGCEKNLFDVSVSFKASK